VFRDVARRHGYQEIRTPTFEDTDLFVRTSGDTSDIVSKEMYTFLDKGERSITLKPEGTAPAMRAVVEHLLCPPGTIARLMYITPCFRYSRPQKGRLRELHQLGLELIGSASPTADAEVIEVTYRFFEACGLSGMTVHLNSIGRSDCRDRYREAILNHLADYLAGQSEESRATANKNPLRLLDTKDPDLRAALAGLRPITDYLEDECRSNFDLVCRRLADAGIPVCVSPDIVRGLDYYTETVFEVLHDQVGSQGSLCGGGRYDNLIEDLGGAPTPSVGVGIGIERTLLAMQAEQVEFESDRPDAFIVQATSEAYDASLALARELRAAGLWVLVDIDGRSAKSQFRQADRSGARVAVVIGPDELARDTAKVKDLATGQQEEFARADLAVRVSRRP
jgi:histidyl-tRNA synthetase